MSDAAFTKLFSSIIHSTIWREPDHVRVVWITMLAMSDAEGYVWASLPGLADAARVTADQCRDALARFMAPDPDSRNKANEGRRVSEAERGWKILNYTEHRNLRSQELARSRKREWWRRNHGKPKQPKLDVPLDTRRSRLDKLDTSRSQKQKSEADSEEKKEETTLSSSPQKPEANIDGSHDFNGNGSELKKVSLAVLAFLNEKTGRNFRPVDLNLNFIRARLKDGITEVQLRQIIAKKLRDWKGTEFERFMRPATLFNLTKCEQYIGELGMPKEEAVNG